MRWLTGILFGLTTVWLLFPILETAMRDLQARTARQLERAGPQYPARSVRPATEACKAIGRSALNADRS